MASSGKRIETRRKAMGLSRGQLAKKLKVSYLRVYRIETGIVRLSLDELPAWARALDVPPAELVA